MKTCFLAVLSAVGLLLAGACTEDRQAETAAAASSPYAAPASGPAAGAAGAVTLLPTTASPIPVPEGFDTSTFRSDARHLAGRVAADLKLTDQATARRLEDAYFVRRQRLARLRARYAADTAGRYAALRQLNDATDQEVRQALPSPALVRTYEKSRADYYDGPFTVGAAETEVEAAAAEATGATVATGAVGAAKAAPAPAAKPRAVRRGPRIVKYKRSGREVKIKYSNGMTLKIDERGHRKVKYGLGAKAKAALESQRRKARQ